MSTKKLIEVALPLEAINKACRADKERKTGTIRNLHKWFAPMPVTALRALIFAALVDDPGDDAERAVLLRITEDLVASVVESPADSVLLRAKAAIAASVPELPVVLDPFCGGGSTLVEAQRLGLVSEGSDLNPVPVLISKALTEIPPSVLGRHPLRRSEGLLDIGASQGLDGFMADLRRYGRLVYDQAQAAISQYYPCGPNGDPVFAWWWARTVPSPDPRLQGAQTPLVTAWWLTKQKGAEEWLEPLTSGNGHLEFAIRTDGQPPLPSKSRCLFSNEPIPFDYIRAQGRNGNLGTMMLAFTTVGAGGRVNWLASEEHQSAARQAQPTEAPTAELPEAALGFRVQGYGMKSWADLFLPRQLLALETFATQVASLKPLIMSEGGSEDYARAVMTVLGLCVGKMAQLHSTLVGWGPRNGPTRALTAFGQQTVSMTWDFCEVNPFGGAQGDWLQTLNTVLRAFAVVAPTGPPATVVQQDARAVSFDSRDCLVVTDPPYFAAIGYADLSDYFYPWLRKALYGVYPELFSTLNSPKLGELIANPSAHESEEEAKRYFVDGFREVFTKLGKLPGAFPILIVYANKESDRGTDPQVSSGWEAMLQAIVEAGLSVVATWPVHGTAAGRVRSMGSNALATYVVLVCRPRSLVANTASRRELASDLRSQLGPAIRLLQSGAIAPVDLAQAVIGPGMAVFTRYKRVLEADGSEMSVRAALLLINSSLAEVLDHQEGDFDAETRWAITWFEEYQFGDGPSGKADSLARAKATSIDGLIRTGTVRARSGRTRLVRRDELNIAYDPRQGSRPTIWEAVQYLVRALEMDGELGAAQIVRFLPDADAARNLAYRLFAICERKNWADEALGYNALVASWPELARLGEGALTGIPDQTLFSE